MDVTEYRLQKLLYVYVSPIVIVVGVIGNSLSFIVLVQRPLRRISTYCYLIILAVADTLVLSAGLLPKWIEQVRISPYPLDLRCKALHLLMYKTAVYKLLSMAESHIKNSTGISVSGVFAPRTFFAKFRSVQIWGFVPEKPEIWTNPARRGVPLARFPWNWQTFTNIRFWQVFKLWCVWFGDSFFTAIEEWRTYQIQSSVIVIDLQNQTPTPRIAHNLDHLTRNTGSSSW